MFSTYSSNSVINGVALPTTQWFKLHTGSPGVAGTSNAAGNTTRKKIHWVTSSSGASSNSTQLQWTSVTPAEDYTHWTTWSASTGGNCIFVGDLTANAVSTGDTFTIAAGDVDITITRGT